MKITSIEKKEYEEVMIDNERYFRYDCLTWKWEYSPEKITSWKRIHELEAAYQRFKNPPFKIFKGSDFIRLSINNFDLDIPVFDPESAAKELEQALNSLMEGK